MDTISHLIPTVLADVIRKAPLTPEKVDFAWRMAVGAELARATKVRLDEAGVLHVDAESPHWAGEVRRARSLIMARLERLLGAETVRRVESGGEPPRRRTRRPPAIE